MRLDESMLEADRSDRFRSSILAHIRTRPVISTTHSVHSPLAPDWWQPMAGRTITSFCGCRQTAGAVEAAPSASIR